MVSQDVLIARIARARDVRRWWSTGKGAPDQVVGLALSGGGIRSATFSLGLIQALACSRRGALDRVDVLSTVSGGGYIGCFLRSLFLPQQARGIAADLEFDESTGAHHLDLDVIAEQAAFARTVLTSGPDRKNMANGQRNPIWWLREHSRYLAPNGATDYGYAVAYLSRNWVAMLYIFALAAAAAMALVTLGEAAFAHYVPPHWREWTWYSLPAGPAPAPCPSSPCVARAAPPGRIVPISPIVVLAAIPLVLSAVLSVAYWWSQAMSANEPSVTRQRRNLLKGVLLAFLGSAVIVGLWWLIERRPGWAASMPSLPLVLGAGISITMAAVAAILVAARRTRRAPLLTAEIRRRLTKELASANFWLLCILVVALLDSCGAGLAYRLRHPLPGIQWHALSVVVAPVAAFLLKKLPDLAEGKGGGTLSWLGRFIPFLALVAGVALYGTTAIGADAVLHYVAWGHGLAWQAPPQIPKLLLVVGTIAVLALASGQATGFINLSSLHLIYATRLTRAYLGASNSARLRQAAQPGPGGEITDNHDADYIQPRLYGLTDLPAPIHIIHTTINETIDPQSQLIARDRKGSILSVEPGGVRTDLHTAHVDQTETVDRAVSDRDGTALTPWSEIGKRKNAENISLGQWCAISGAAASSGMGRLTHLGYALALTFANVRLGYWWWSPGICKDVPPPGRFFRGFARVFGTFVYLSNELTARYSRGYQRKYLTDGGHFENSGAYALIRRRVPLILVSDNGADPAYGFADLENLIRTVRLDLGAETVILDGPDLAVFVQAIGCTDQALFVDPARTPDWRDKFGSVDRRDAILALRVTFPDEPGGDELRIVWIKPRLLGGMTQDLVGYASRNPDFPQQTTANQFFDEAQWESYRKLGQFSMERLLATCPALLA